MSMDLGDSPVGTAPSAAEQLQIRTAIGAMASSGGTFTGNVTLGEEVSFFIDPAIGTDHKWSAIKATTGVCGETIALGHVVTQGTNGKWYLADADITAGSNGDVRRRLGVVLAGDVLDAACTIMLNGVIRDSHFGNNAGVIGAAVYASRTGGGIVIPSAGAAPFADAGAVVRIIGHVSAQYEIDFNPDNVWSVIAA